MFVERGEREARSCPELHLQFSSSMQDITVQRVFSLAWLGHCTKVTHTLRCTRSIVSQLVSELLLLPCSSYCYYFFNYESA